MFNRYDIKMIEVLFHNFQFDKNDTKSLFDNVKKVLNIDIKKVLENVPLNNYHSYKLNNKELAFEFLKNNNLDNVTSFVENENDMFIDIFLYKYNINAFTHDGTTALMYSCENGNYNMVNKLLLRGASPNCRRITDDNTSLHLAALKSYRSIIELLCNYNSKLKLNYKNETALDICKSNNDISSASTIISYIDYNQYIEMCDNTDDEFIVKSGLYIYKYKDFKRYALYWTHKKNNLKCMEDLFRQGFDTNIKDINGNDLMQYACSENDECLFKLLMKYNYKCKNNKNNLIVGVKKCFNNNNNMKPALNYAVDFKNYNFIEILVNSGADFDKNKCENIDDEFIISFLKNHKYI